MVDKIVAKVGSEYILLSEVEEEYSYALSKDPTLDEDIKCRILDNIIANKIMVYQAQLDSIDVPDSEVELQLNYRFDAVLQMMNNDEAFFAEEYGATVEEMKNRYRDDQRQKMLAEKMQYKLISDIEITPKEVKEFIQKIPTDSLPYFKSEMEISEIIVKPQVNEEERQKAFSRATDIYNKIKSGEISFGEAAKKYSADPGSALREGDLGFAKRGAYVPEFEAAVFTGKKDELMEPVETEYGFHIIEVIERRGNSVRARHVLVKPQITYEDEEKARKLLDSIRNLIINDSLTFQEAVSKYSDKDTPSYSNSGRVKNANTNNTFFQADDFDPDTYFAVFDLPTNGVSKVVEIKTPPAGDKAYRLLQVNSKTKPHKASIKEDYDKLANYAKESKRAEIFQKWLAEKKKVTYIVIDPLFEQCSKIINGE
jgi:peptidyl-prolyl cis-trans isomerase SurA